MIYHFDGSQSENRGIGIQMKVLINLCVNTSKMVQQCVIINVNSSYYKLQKFAYF